MKNFIEYQKVVKHYPDSAVVVDNVSFSVERGEFLSIVGPSGAGKSTLLRLLLGEVAPTSGVVRYAGVAVHELSRYDISRLRRKIGMVFQDYRLLPDRNAYENIAFAMEAAGRTDEDIERDVPAVLDLVGLTKKLWNFPRELSGGERQRVAIARAIINQPQVLVADEPTGNLDPQNTDDVMHILKKVNDLGTTVLLTTHNKGVVDSLKKRVITISDGKIVRDDEHGKYEL
ncbi:MAG: cell division ATP-binding protein FtsE [Candidatus Vogelbacteria bacterium CG10_big_fil_rev_8_21_14_0_10_45_14]|uniref:Cell division ATP-binding protein FtsE n=1 Tax=Candidatus Vogelbacteria bacterium CG10_big_fil_rev_8_21_14_0_10_45_14 TaxID=1975042 RepID=A0A2H0RJE6_9BACT|nr:MAG: cell division ATP-binding protein FtsE [Candidatus Vogelbacteria bacterium CG10_big_fil_rev_8_21_14_0_10_45_14]